MATASTQSIQIDGSHIATLACFNQQRIYNTNTCGNAMPDFFYAFRLFRLDVD